jgi:hypothetical protein
MLCEMRWGGPSRMRLAGAISQWFATKIGSRELPNMDARQIDTWRQRRKPTLPRPAAALTRLSFGTYFAGPQHQEAAATHSFGSSRAFAGQVHQRVSNRGFQHLVAAPAEVEQMFPSHLVARHPDLPPDALLGPPAAELLPTSRPKRILLIVTLTGFVSLLRGLASPACLRFAVITALIGLYFSWATAATASQPARPRIANGFGLRAC